MQWVSVKDGLPEKEDTVLLWVGRFSEMYLGWYSLAYCEWVSTIGSNQIPQDWITHWMPLPKPPAAD